MKMVRHLMDLKQKPIITAVSAKYVGLSDKSSKNWFGPVKISLGPIKIVQFFKLFL